MALLLVPALGVNSLPRSSPDDGLTLDLIRGELPSDLDLHAQSVADNPWVCLLETRAFAAHLLPRMHHLVVRVQSDLAGVLSFYVNGPSLVVVNECVAMPTTVLDRCASWLFDEYPDATRLQLINTSRPEHIDSPHVLPSRTISRGIENYVLELPRSIQEFSATFSGRTRQRLRSRERQLAKALPGSRNVVVTGGAIDAALIDAIVALNHARMRAKGGRSLLDASFAVGLRTICRTRGVVCAYLDGDRVIAGTISVKVGRGWSLFVIAHDPALNQYSPGTLCMLRAIEAAIDDGASRFNLMWGKSDYKTRLGARPIALCDRYWYRSRLAWFLDYGVVFPGRVAAVRAAVHALRRWLHLGQFIPFARSVPGTGDPDDTPADDSPAADANGRD